MIRTIAAVAVALAGSPATAGTAVAATAAGGADAGCYLFSSFQAMQPNLPADRQKMLFNIAGFYAARVTSAHSDDAKLKAALEAAQATLLAKRADAAFMKQFAEDCFATYAAQNKRIYTITSGGATPPVAPKKP